MVLLAFGAITPEYGLVYVVHKRNETTIIKVKKSPQKQPARMQELVYCT